MLDSTTAFYTCNFSLETSDCFPWILLSLTCRKSVLLDCVNCRGKLNVSQVEKAYFVATRVFLAFCPLYVVQCQMILVSCNNPALDLHVGVVW